MKLRLDDNDNDNDSTLSVSLAISVSSFLRYGLTMDDAVLAVMPVVVE